MRNEIIDAVGMAVAIPKGQCRSGNSRQRLRARPDIRIRPGFEPRIDEVTGSCVDLIGDEVRKEL